MKGALAAILLAATEVTGLRGDVIVTLVADEELGSIGTEEMLERIQADAAIVAEPTELRVAIAHRGFVGFEIETTGVAAHGSRPDLGVDAIAKMGPILVALAELDQRLQRGARHPLVGSASLHASLIEGGQELSSFPAQCVVTGERRTIPGETVDQVQQELTAIAQDSALRIIASRDPLAPESDHPFVELIGTRRRCRRLRGCALLDRRRTDRRRRDPDCLIRTGRRRRTRCGRVGQPRVARTGPERDRARRCRLVRVNDQALAGGLYHP